MAEDAATSDLVELTRQSVDALNRGDFDAYTGFLDPDAVWEATTLPASLEGATAIRELAEDLLTTQVAFTVTGPKRKIDEFAQGLNADELATIRAERAVMLSPL